MRSRSLPSNTTQFFFIVHKKVNIDKMLIILTYGKFPCSIGRMAFVNNKFSISYLPTMILLFSRHVSYNYFSSSHVRWSANNFTPKAYMHVRHFFRNRLNQIHQTNLSKIVAYARADIFLRCWIRMICRRLHKCFTR